MDAKQAVLKEKLNGILEQAAGVAAEIQALEQGPGTPHYDQIEIPAHEIGQRLSRMIQASRIGEVAAGQHTECDCPECGLSCPVELSRREVHSMDGPVELIETVAYCRRCRRDFFPSA